MKYTLNISSNNVTYKDGDTLIISFSDPFLYIQSIDDISFDFTPLDTLSNGHDIYFRWSYDVAQLDRATGKPHIVWSAWEDYRISQVENPNFNQIVTSILAKKTSIDIQFRLIRRGTEVSARRIDKVVLDITHHNPPETPVGTPFPVESSCKASSCVSAKT